MSIKLLSAIFLIGVLNGFIACSNDLNMESELNDAGPLNALLSITCNGKTLQVPIDRIDPVQSKAISVEKPADLIFDQNCVISMFQSTVDSSKTWLAQPGELYRSRQGGTSVQYNQGTLSISGEFYITHQLATTPPPVSTQPVTPTPVVVQADPSSGTTQPPGPEVPYPQAPTPSPDPAYHSCDVGATCNSGWGWITENGGSCKAGAPGWVDGKGGCSCKC